jgi:hypothetical protein
MWLHDHSQDTVLKAKSQACEAYERAVRNCPWSVALWLGYARASERSLALHDKMTGFVVYTPFLLLPNVFQIFSVRHWLQASSRGWSTCNFGWVIFIIYSAESIGKQVQVPFVKRFSYMFLCRSEIYSISFESCPDCL